MPIITISRQMCSLGDEVAQALASRLGWEIITRSSLVSHFSAADVTPYDLHMLAESAKYYLRTTKSGITYVDVLKNELSKHLENNSALLIGFGSQVIFAGRRDAVHVRIIAPKEIRIARAKKQHHVSQEQAEQIIATADKKHKKFVSAVFGSDLSDPANYHLILNTADLCVDECVSSILALLNEREQQRSIELQSKDTPVSDNADRLQFKNESEAEFAKLLDMYQIEWKYEPKTFPIEWDAEGNITMAFSPDFYLTKFDTYIELTTMNQKYVTTKNKKAKKLREMYPGTNIKVVYKKDFFSLLERYKLIKGD